MKITKPTILNRDFEHPADGWYMIEALGNHPNRASQVVQVIDDKSAQSIVTTFNSAAKGGTLRHGHEMLIDHEHFKDDADKETRAYGWLQELQNRDDGIYGRIRWTGTGKTAVDGGDYRFFSTEYDPPSLEVLNDARMRKVRPLQLDGLSLTNMNNNRGKRPITNRRDQAEPGPQIKTKLKNKMKKLPDDKTCPDCDVKLKKQDDGTHQCPECDEKFSGDKSEETTKTKNRNQMKDIAKLLGLSEDASESAVSTELTKLKNRLTELETDNQKLLGEQSEALLDTCNVTDEKVRNRMKPILAGMKNREERLGYLADFGFVPGAAAKKETTRVLNRGGSGAAAQVATAESGDDEKVRAEKIKNRCTELQGKGIKYNDAWNQAMRENTPSAQ